MEPTELRSNEPEIVADLLKRVEAGSLSAKEALHQLENTQLFLFHGTPEKIASLDPRQPHNVVDGERIPHGDPAVCVTPFADVAIFRAIVNSKLGRERNIQRIISGFGIQGGKISYRINTPEALDAARDPVSHGYVLVCSRDGFSEFSPMEWRSAENVTPLGNIQVSGSDLPDTIAIE